MAKGSNYKKLFGNKVAEGGETDNEGRAPERIVARRTRQTAGLDQVLI